MLLLNFFIYVIENYIYSLPIIILYVLQYFFSNWEFINLSHDSNVVIFFVYLYVVFHNFVKHENEY